jgi:AcrR family transcriptional regulator
MKRTAPDTKTRILETAAQMFYKHGYRATGVDTIAKAVGITKATLYHHFENIAGA